MSAQHTADLGCLGNVSFPSNEPERIAVSMDGRQYRLVWSKLVNGSLIERPYDERIFDSVYDAQRELRIAKARGQ